MDSDKLDKYLQDRLDGHREVIDKEGLWQDLDIQPKKKKNRFLFFWLVGLLGLSLISYKVYQVETNIDLVNESGEPTLAVRSASLPGLVEDKPIVKEQRETAEERNFITPSFATPTPTPAISSTLTIQSPTKSITKAPAIEKSTLFVEEHLLNETILESENRSNGVPAKFLDTGTNNNMTIQATAVKVNETTFITNDNKSASGYLNSVSEPLAQLQLSQLKILTPYVTIRQRSLFEISSPFSVALPVEPEAKYAPWAVNFNCSAFNLNRKLTAISPNTESVDRYIQNRNLSESMNEALAVGLGIEYQLKNGVYFRAGLEGLTINEQFNLTYSSDSIVIDRGLLLEYHTDTIAAFNGLTYTNSQVTERWDNSNNHIILNIPLTIGYRLAYNRWGLKAELTGVLSKYLKFNGLMLSQNDVVISTTQDLNSYGWGLRAGIGVDYLINEDFAISLMSQMQRDGRSFLKNETQIKQQYKMLGIQLGISYQI